MEPHTEDTIETNIEQFFPINQKISVTRLFAEETENYPSYVKDMDDKSIFIDTLTKGGITMPLYPNGLIEVAVITKDGIWTGKTTVIKTESGQISGAWIRFPKGLKKYQRREFMRWEFKFPVKISIMNEGGLAEEVNGECYNISGNGIAVSSRHSLPRHSELRVKFTYNDISVDSRVKFIHAQYDSSQKTYITGFQFLEVDNRTADKIHKVGVLNQLEMRRKGLM